MLCPISFLSKNLHKNKCQITYSVSYQITPMLHVIHIYTYQDFVGVFSADGEGDVIYGEFDRPCVGYCLASPVVILHSHLERH